jgi:uncharacterized protein
VSDAALPSIDIRGASPLRDDASLLALNNAHETETSRLDPAKLRHLLSEAFMATAIGRDSAMLIAFDHSADYDSPNFVWFQQHLDRFVYVDRIIVAASSRGRGYARRLYQELFATARAAKHSHVVCEVNVDPPNPASDAFHDALGFREMGRALLANGKTVRYLLREIA